LSRHPRFLVAVSSCNCHRAAGTAAIVAALGILALYGRAGYFAAIVVKAGPISMACSGILVAHVFFNLPLRRGCSLRHWARCLPINAAGEPARHGGEASLRLIEWPVLRAALPGVAGLVFMLCITSFTIVLILGGGPAATTLEVAIYQALRFDFDPARAVTLTVLQIALTFAVVLVLTRLGANTVGDANLPVGAAPLPFGRQS